MSKMLSLLACIYRFYYVFGTAKGTYCKSIANFLYLSISSELLTAIFIQVGFSRVRCIGFVF